MHQMKQARRRPAGLAVGDEATARGYLSAGPRLPDEDLPFAWNRGVSYVTLIGRISVVIGYRDPQRHQVFGIPSQEYGIVRAGIREGRQQWDLGQGNDRAADHPGTGSDLGTAHQEDAPSLHLQTGEISHWTPNRD